MAYFERSDEFDMRVDCEICGAKLAERSVTAHKSKCIIRNSSKFSECKLERCKYNFNHIILAGKMKDHLEFCNKYQQQLVTEFQQAFHNKSLAEYQDESRSAGVGADQVIESGLTEGMHKLEI